MGVISVNCNVNKGASQVLLTEVSTEEVSFPQKI